MIEMKNSGIEWIGSIPAHWKTLRLKYASTLKGRIGWQGLRTDEYLDEGPFLITGTDFDNGMINWNSCVHISEGRFNQDINIQIKEDDLLVTKDGTIGKVAIALNCPEKVSLNSGVFIVRNNKGYKYVDKFLYYVILSNEFLLWYDLSQHGNSTIKHLTQENFYEFSFAYPPIDEQRKIAAFLDKHCSKLDELIKGIEEQLNILDNYKKSVISESVTKGLNKTVKMKNTPIAWAKEIPAHWEYMPNKYVMKKIKNICSIYNGEDIISLSMNGVVVRDLDAGGKMPTSFDGYQFVYPGNLLMCLFDYDVTPRCIGHINNYGVTSPAYSQFVMKNGNCAKYYYYYYLKIDNTKELLHLAKNLRHSFTEDELGRINAVVPPVEEQKEIADYLDKKCAEIDLIINEKKKQLEALENCKKSLIYEYVTGKREVPNE